MNNNKNTVIAVFVLCAFMLTILSACNITQNDESSGWVVETVTTVVDSDSSDNNHTTTVESSSKKQNSSKNNKPISSNKTDSGKTNSTNAEESIYTHCTKQMLEKSIFFKGDNTRLASKIKAALKNKNSTTKIAFLGDSITAGAVVDLGAMHYANIFADYWRENIGNKVNVNIQGYPATTSHLGVHIVEDVVLKDKPDIIFIEYVNDADGEQFTLNCIDSLLRKCLSLDNKPAVILLEMSYHGTTNAQNTHYKAAKEYGVPMISWQNALRLPMINGDIKWSDVSPDEVHPNKMGHRMLAEMMWYYTDLVLPTASAAKEPAAFNIAAVTDDVYKNTKILDRTNLKPSDIGNFTESIEHGPFNNGWATTSGGSITFKVTAMRIALAYLSTEQYPNGKAEVYVDGKLASTITIASASFTSIRTQHLKSFKTLEEHTVTVKILEGTKDDFQILSLLIAQ